MKDVPLSELDATQQERLQQCVGAYQSRQLVISRDGITAIRLNLNVDDPPWAVQISLHEAGHASRILCMAFFDRQGRVLNFRDALPDLQCDSPST